MDFNTDMNLNHALPQEMKMDTPWQSLKDVTFLKSSWLKASKTSQKPEVRGLHIFQSVSLIPYLGNVNRNFI